MSNNGIDFADFIFINRNECKKKIEEIFKENKDKSIAIAINGKWGVGKSYFWKNEMTPFLKKELDITPIYTSVFGKKDENEIIKDLVSQFLTIENKNADNIRDFIEGTFKFFGKNIDMDSLFKFFKKEHMKNTIVCIDDFERLSDKIPVQDVLGLISELKENKECSVVVIYNEDELFKNDNFNQENNKDKSKITKEKMIFEKYKEKVFDFQIKFAPSSIEQFSIFMSEKLEKNFDAYKYFPDIINIDKLLQTHNFTNLRELNRVNCTYQTLLKDFSLEKYPSEEFKNIYNYILYPIAYAYHFGLKPEYFEKNNIKGTTNLSSPHTSIYSNLLKELLSYLKDGFEIMQKTSFLYIPQLFPNPNGYTPIQECKIFLLNFVKKIIDDTNFHMEYIKELNDKTSLEEASICFFLKHKNDIKSIPYMFGYRILNYAFNDEDSIELKRTKSFALELVIKKHEKEVLDLFNQWCNKAHEVIINNKNEQEYFWINKFTFYLPLESLSKKLNIPIPQNKLVELFIKN
ncbi:KAP family NTPase [Campylobacter sp. CNRCH_2016_0050h]|uniref:KAP family NTPase n=1 Tax=Campylobacter sp. CNRCH_2016_0050h TaxID=2911608 RepID=UPI0021E666FD|nr:KAP family NTPase [Campylobacter sp. CNRCH_2016_0050h]MCV3457486.1 KAP family NTPase [Campylobacter sp. CNRCH_2016_0050h]